MIEIFVPQKTYLCVIKEREREKKSEIKKKEREDEMREDGERLQRRGRRELKRFKQNLFFLKLN